MNKNKYYYQTCINFSLVFCTIFIFFLFNNVSINANEPLKDIYGNPIRYNVEYYIRHTNPGWGSYRDIGITRDPSRPNQLWLFEGRDLTTQFRILPADASNLNDALLRTGTVLNNSEVILWTTQGGGRGSGLTDDGYGRPSTMLMGATFENAHRLTVNIDQNNFHAHSINILRGTAPMRPFDTGNNNFRIVMENRAHYGSWRFVPATSQHVAQWTIHTAPLLPFTVTANNSSSLTNPSSFTVINNAPDLQDYNIIITGFNESGTSTGLTYISRDDRVLFYHIPGFSRYEIRVGDFTATIYPTEES